MLSITHRRAASLLAIVAIVGVFGMPVLSRERVAVVTAPSPSASVTASPSPSASVSASPSAVSTAAAAKTYVGSEKCRDCHDEAARSFDSTPMGVAFRLHPRTDLQKQDCEACHGPGSAHVDDTSVPGTLITFGPKQKSTSMADQNKACLQCHESGRHTFFRGSSHDLRNIGCTSCHSLHHEISPRAQLTTPTVQQLCTQCHLDKWAKSMRVSHMPQEEGKLECTTCHDPHGTPAEHDVKADTPNELCYKCHVEKRGPFLWEHAPVKENCMTCHNPHGSNNDGMLKVRAERLCQQCHVAVDHPSQPHSPGSRFEFNRSCLNCHSMVHGSNHPAGNLFLR